MLFILTSALVENLILNFSKLIFGVSELGSSHVEGCDLGTNKAFT